MSVKVRQAISQADFVAIFRLRIEVFIIEQKVPIEEELDNYDSTAFHGIAELDGEPVGTGRLLEANGTWKIGRMAVREASRRSGVGQALLDFLEAEARRRGVTEVILAAQVTAIGFYERCGYQVYGDVFDDAGIDHRWAKKSL